MEVDFERHIKLKFVFNSFIHSAHFLNVHNYRKKSKNVHWALRA